jgi:hypothetical protein
MSKNDNDLDLAYIIAGALVGCALAALVLGIMYLTGGG